MTYSVNRNWKVQPYIHERVETCRSSHGPHLGHLPFCYVSAGAAQQTQRRGGHIIRSAPGLGSSCLLLCAAPPDPKKALKQEDE